MFCHSIFYARWYKGLYAYSQNRVSSLESPLALICTSNFPTSIELNFQPCSRNLIFLSVSSWENFFRSPLFLSLPSSMFLSFIHQLKQTGLVVSSKINPLVSLGGCSPKCRFACILAVSLLTRSKSFNTLSASVVSNSCLTSSRSANSFDIQYASSLAGLPSKEKGDSKKESHW